MRQSEQFSFKLGLVKKKRKDIIMDIKGKTINFLGDSITAGSGTDKIFFQIIEEKYGLKKANGYGIGGTRIARQQSPSVEPVWDEYFASRVDGMDENADVVFVFGGTNDYGHGDAPLGKSGDKTPDTFYGACYDLYLKLTQKYVGKTVVIATPIHRLNEDNVYGEGNKAEATGTLKDYVEIIKEVAEYFALPVCDLYSISGIQPNIPFNREAYTEDGLHPNRNGHELMAERIAGFLLSL